MTPDRIQEIRQERDKLKLNLERSLAMQKLEPLRPYSYVLAWPETEVILEALAALATAEAEGRRKGIEEGKAKLQAAEHALADLTAAASAQVIVDQNGEYGLSLTFSEPRMFSTGFPVQVSRQLLPKEPQ